MEGSSRVGSFYESHPYPQPVDDLEAYRQLWDDTRRRADSHLFWPGERYREMPEVSEEEHRCVGDLADAMMQGFKRVIAEKNRT